MYGVTTCVITQRTRMGKDVKIEWQVQRRTHMYASEAAEKNIDVGIYQRLFVHTQ